jgi:hypothetical protein
MWPFASPKSIAMPISENLQLSLIKNRGVNSQTVSAWRMIEERGNYSDRPVTYFRVFDPTNAKWGSSEVRRYADLDVGRILHSGHIERDGLVVLNRDSGQT